MRLWRFSCGSIKYDELRQKSLIRLFRCHHFFELLFLKLEKGIKKTQNLVSFHHMMRKSADSNKLVLTK